MKWYTVFVYQKNDLHSAELYSEKEIPDNLKNIQEIESMDTILGGKKHTICVDRFADKKSAVNFLKKEMDIHKRR